MPAHVIGQPDTRDGEAYQAYLDGFLPSFLRHGGELLAASAQPTEVLEGTWSLPKTVLMRFPDRAAARAWHGDPEYRELARIRQRSAETNLVIVDGLDGEWR